MVQVPTPSGNFQYHVFYINTLNMIAGDDVSGNLEYGTSTSGLAINPYPGNFSSAPDSRVLSLAPIAPTSANNSLEALVFYVNLDLEVNVLHGAYVENSTSWTFQNVTDQVYGLLSSFTGDSNTVLGAPMGASSSKLTTTSDMNQTVAMAYYNLNYTSSANAQAIRVCGFNWTAAGKPSLPNRNLTQLSRSCED